MLNSRERFASSNLYWARVLAVAALKAVPIADSIRRTDGKFELGWPSLAELVDPSPELLYSRALARLVAAAVPDERSTYQTLVEEGETDVAQTLSVADNLRGSVSEEKLSRENFLAESRKLLDLEVGEIVGHPWFSEAVRAIDGVLARYEVEVTEVQIAHRPLGVAVDGVANAVASRTQHPSHSFLSFYLGLVKRGSVA